MAVLLHAATLRELAHALLDKFLDERTSRELRSRADIRMEDVVEPATRATRAAPSARPRITADKAPAKKAPAAKPAPPAPHQYPDVTVSCRSSCSRLEIAVNLSAQVAKRLGLMPFG